MLVVGGLTLYIVGVVTGIYFATQIEKNINKRIK